MSGDREGIFRWDTIQVVGPDTLPFSRPVVGYTVEVELTSGRRIHGFRAADGVSYFCHGMTFGGTSAPGGAVSPYSGREVATILEDFFLRLDDEAEASAGDIIVWYDSSGRPIHSALLIYPVVLPETARLANASLLRSKNGMLPEADYSLGDLVIQPDGYGEAFAVFRRK
jgi:hypothetical protein